MATEGMKLKDAADRSPFPIGLQYNTPARGVWNIVNIAMMIPESHVIFVCPMGCMRGVTLTAAEMGAMDRFTAIFITEQDVLAGNGERLIVDGVSEVINSKKIRPKAVCVFTSCIDQFLGTDHKFVFRTLEDNYKEIGFIECFMTPTMRKGALPPDPIMRKQLFALLKKTDIKQKTVNFIGNNLPLPEENEFKQVILRAGYRSLDIANCKTFLEYQDMAKSDLNILIHPNGNMAVKDLEKRLSTKYLNIPLSYDMEVIEENYRKLAQALNLTWNNEQNEYLKIARKKAEDAVNRTKIKIGNIPIAIDYTMTTRPFGLAQFLAVQGFYVREIYAESCHPEEEKAFLWLKEKEENMHWYYPMEPIMAEFKSKKEQETLALGQIAAYFTNTPYFVNAVESDGMYGFHGIEILMNAMEEALETKKDLEHVIQIKALGCTETKKEASWNRL